MIDNYDDLSVLLDNLSPALKSVWAKSGQDEGDPSAFWLPLVGHAMDAAGVVGFLWDEWLSESQKKVIADCFPPKDGRGSRVADRENIGADLEEKISGDDHDTDPSSADRLNNARTFVVLAAALHDIGKISKPFSRQIGRFADQMAEQGLVTASQQSQEGKDNRWMKHGLAGAVAIEKVAPSLGWHRSVATALATLAGGHHGIPTQTTQLVVARKNRLHYLIDADPQDPWLDTQREFARFAATYTEASELSTPVTFTTSALAIIQGLVMMADWISSSTVYFHLTPSSDREFRYLRSEGGQGIRVEGALEQLSLPPQWKPVDLGVDASVLLSRRFGVSFPARPLQDEAVSAARSLPGPGMLIIEDAMGSGKTEAALLAAEILASRFGANGLVIALPTQATTDAMFSRLLRFLEVGLGDELEEEVNENEIFEEDEGSFSSLPPSIALMHGRSHWNSNFVRLGRSGRSFLDRFIGGFEVELGEGRIDPEFDVKSEKPIALVHPWLRGRNKTILSSFVATTVDHLLMGALQMKYLAFRHLGLSSKVVVFDEVHASSRFMNFFAERIIEWLGSYRVPVMMLSATLDSELRNRLSSAYQRGLRTSQPGALRSRAPSPVEQSTTTNGFRAPYPRLTAVSRDSVEVISVEPATPPRTVRVIAQSPNATPASVARELAAGREGNILVLVNTVTRAQDTYAELAAEFGNSVRLVHARFTAADRMENDRWLLETYGPASSSRPQFSIVVSTQVVEQSLDVDFDVLISDVAPVDLVLQRIGRVHRHAGRHRPGAMENAVCHLIGVPSFKEEPDRSEVALKRAATIYGWKPVLSGALALGPDMFEDEGAAVILPQDIGDLVERSSAGDFVVPPSWTGAMRMAREQWNREEEEAAAEVAQTRLAPPDKRLGIVPTLNDWYGIMPGSDDGPARVARARVRDGMEGLEVVLVQEVGEDLFTMANSSRPNGVFLPQDIAPTPQVAQQALLGSVTLPAWAVHDAEKVINELENRCWGPGWSSSYLLSGQLFLPLVDGEAELAGYRYRYSRQTGLEVKYDR